MKNKYSMFWRGTIFCLFAFMLMANISFAALQVSFGSITDKDGKVLDNSTFVNDLKSDSPQYFIDSYGSNPFGSDPRITTNRLQIAKDDAAARANSGITSAMTIDYSKYLGYMTIDNNIFYLRGNQDNSPLGSVYVRVWNGTPNTQGSYYSAAKGFANGSKAMENGTLTAKTEYKADVPYKPVITKIDETASTSYPGEQKSSSLTVSSAQTAGTDGKREISGYLWDIKPAPKGTPNLAESNLTLAADQVSAGETYTFKVGYRNWFNKQGEYIWSDTVSYKIGSGGQPGTVSFTPSLYGPRTDKLVINMIAPPKEMNVEDLATLINTTAKEDVVISITHSLPGVEGTIYYETYAPSRPKDSKTFIIKAGEGVQVYLKKKVDITLTR